VFSILAFNLMRGLQARVTERRRSNRKRRALHTYETIQTLRYRFINRAGLLVQRNGRATLDVGNNRMVRERFQTIEQALSAGFIATLRLRDFPGALEYWAGTFNVPTGICPMDGRTMS
jgi:hypothetical protein